MFTFVRRFQFSVLSFITLLGLAVTSVVHASDIEACFNYLNAQDYAHAEQTGRALLQRTDLARTEQRDAHLCLGRAYSERGGTRDALLEFQQVESLSQNTKELAVAYGFLGLTYSHLNDLDRAELYDQRAIKAFRELHNKSSEASTLNNLAIVVEKRGDVDRALTLYQKALALEPDKAKKPAMLSNIALIHYKRNDYAKAERLLRQAIEIDRRNGNAHDVAKWQLNLGDILRRDGKIKEAEKELMAGYNAIHLIGDKAWEAQACWNLAQLTLANKNTQPAIEWARKAEALYREIGDTEKADMLAEMLADQ